MICGGAEAPITPMGWGVCGDARALHPEWRTRARLAPVGQGRDGFVVGEGAGVLVIEETGVGASAGRDGAG